MTLSEAIMAESEPYSKMVGRIVCKFGLVWMGLDPTFFWLRALNGGT